MVELVDWFIFDDDDDDDDSAKSMGASFPEAEHLVIELTSM
jgi:hypothetical protein